MTTDAFLEMLNLFRPEAGPARATTTLAELQAEPIGALDFLTAVIAYQLTFHVDVPDELADSQELTVEEFVGAMEKLPRIADQLWPAKCLKLYAATAGHHAGPTGAPPIRSVTRYLDAVGIVYTEEEDDGSPSCHFDVKGRNGDWHCVLHLTPDDPQCVFVAWYGDEINDEARQKVLEFINRVNLMHSTGSLKLTEEGRVVYQCGLDLVDRELTVIDVRNLVRRSLFAMNICYPGVLAVAHAGLTAEEGEEIVQKEAAREWKPQGDD